MIREINKQLEELQEKLARKKRVEKLLDGLYAQEENDLLKVEALEKIKLKEDKDVKKLEGISVQALLCAISGKKEEKLDKEKREAYAATAKYELAKKQLDEVREQIKTNEIELELLFNVEARYDHVINKKVDYIKKLGNKYADHIKLLEQDAANKKSRLKEIEEAIRAGNRAFEKSNTVLKHLDRAMDYSTWDIFGGGTIADVLKHSELADAQKLVEALQRDLRDFNIELKDVNMDIDSNIDVRVEGFLGFADYWMDGFFVDWTVRNHIEESTSKVNQIKSNIKHILEQLIEEEEKTVLEQKGIKEKIEKIVIGV